MGKSEGSIEMFWLYHKCWSELLGLIDGGRIVDLFHYQVPLDMLG